MSDKSSRIFQNPIDDKTLKSAERSKKKYQKKYGDDSAKVYPLESEPIETLDFLSVRKLREGQKGEALDEKALVVGNIRMGFGHYRISIAMASCARALGYTPYWLDLSGFEATGSAMIREQNQLYSLASRISQRSRLFNHFIWEPLNSEGFKQLTYNAKDQKNAELLVPILSSLPKEIPYIATHVWPSQAAVHAGLTHVVNAIPDNWPMALHLSEGAIHTVQTEYAYLGYKMLHGFAKQPLHGIPEDQLKMVGRYVDHELLVHLAEDNARRIRRAQGEGPVRFLMTVGGAGAGFTQFVSMVRHLLPYVKAGRAALFINFGDHADVYQKMKKAVDLGDVHEYIDAYEALKQERAAIYDGQASGIYAICHKDIFQAVYATNLLMPACDILITKPSELAYYPIPKLFMRHIGGHEVYGAISSAEAGDGTFECPTEKTANEMIDRLLQDPELYSHMCRRILRMKEEGYYNGAYECVRLAAGEKA